MRIPEAGCQDLVVKESDEPRAGDGAEVSPVGGVPRSAIRLVPSDLRFEQPVGPNVAPRLNDGLADILDWYIRMAGEVDLSWSPSDE